MKILIYGAGVLGSYLAHELYHGKHSVTMIARGKRFDDLKKHGLVIWHTRQKTKTVDSVQVTDRLNPEDTYDIIFVVMKKSQLSDVLPILAKNTSSKMIVLMGNNSEADKTYANFMRISTAHPMLLYGFLSCAGHRDNEVIHNWHKKNCTVIIGSYLKQDDFEDIMKAAFSQTTLQLDIKPDINAWLKYHSALIAPLCLAIQYEGGASRGLYTSKALKLSIDAVKESIKMFEDRGFYNEPPHLSKETHKTSRKGALILIKIYNIAGQGFLLPEWHTCPTIGFKGYTGAILRHRANWERVSFHTSPCLKITANPHNCRK
ncbi:MAG: 2-dehydropantoate 2-reductase N-terminal domain-containing protein [Anaerocolumna sp.]